MTMETMAWRERVDNLTDHLLGTKKGDILSIHGSIGSGKTRLLRDLATQLASRGAIPLYLSPPQGEEDTAGAAIAAAADTLKDHRLLNGESADLRDLLVSRERKIEIILSGIGKASNSVVLLLDEPARWIASETYGESSSVAREFALQVSRDLITKSHCRVVYTGRAFGIQAEEETYRLPKAWNESDLPSSLVNHPTWKEVNRGLKGKYTVQKTPLLYRMLTMLSVIATPADAIAAAQMSLGVPEIGKRLAHHCEIRPQFLRAWACFSLSRKSIDNDLYETLVEGLDTDLRFVAEELLLTRVEEGYELHPLLARSIESRAVLGTDYWKIQELYTRHYLRNSRSLADSTEAFFHANAIGDDHLVGQTQPFFIEQLHLKGRSLSKRKKHLEAADVFRQAADLDPNDDYAHHYLAFNLDWMAEDQETIEDEYQKAIDLNSHHPWWHSRWINYLITVGKTTVARAAFEDASEALQEVTESHPEYVYRSLHLWVGALLLHRAQLDFARQILDCVPPAVRREHRGFVALEEQLTALEEARRGRGVFPLSVPASQHWRTSPHLDFPPQVEGKDLRSWYPARVEVVKEREIVLVVGKPPESNTPPNYGMIDLSIERFDDATLDAPARDLVPGRFVELAFYGDEGIMRTRVHPKVAWEDPDLPFLAPPDTLRYLRRQERSS